MAKELTGTVVSVGMQKTIVVSVGRVSRHPKYGKILRRQTKLLAHNELEGVKAGDTVKIQETKPYSRNTFFKVVGTGGKDVREKKPEVEAKVEIKHQTAPKKSKIKNARKK